MPKQSHEVQRTYVWKLSTSMLSDFAHCVDLYVSGSRSSHSTDIGPHQAHMKRAPSLRVRRDFLSWRGENSPTQRFRFATTYLPRFAGRQSAVSAPVSPHNAARSPLFRLIAPSTVDLPYRGQWLPPLDGATERVLLASDKLTAAELRGARTSTDLVIIGAVDSGCTGSLTPHHRALINVRPCDEKFSSADGTVTSATCIGDMPVTIRDHLGHPHTVVFRNVRCVPDFHYTLLSVTQLWQEQRIDARFADSRSLHLPNGLRFPYLTGRRLPSLSMVSMAHLGPAASSSPTLASATLPASPTSTLSPSMAPLPPGWWRQRQLLTGQVELGLAG